MLTILWEGAEKFSASSRREWSRGMEHTFYFTFVLKFNKISLTDQKKNLSLLGCTKTFLTTLQNLFDRIYKVVKAVKSEYFYLYISMVLIMGYGTLYA